MSLSDSRSGRRSRSAPLAPEPRHDPVEPAPTRGLGGVLGRLKGLLGGPIKLQRRDGQWHVVIDDGRGEPAPAAPPPDDAQVLAELRARLRSMDPRHVATAMRELAFVHEGVRRQGWSALDGWSVRELARALVQAEVLSSLDASPALDGLVAKLGALKAAAEAREQRRAAAQAEALQAHVEVSETSFDEFDETQRNWIDTAPPAPPAERADTPG